VSLADMAADVRAATPTDAARIVVPDRVAMAGELDSRTLRMEQHIRQNLLRREQELLGSVNRMERFVRQPIERLARAAINLRRDLGTIERTLQLRDQRLELLVRNLKNVDPKSVLARGYSVIRQNNKVVKSAADIQDDQSFMIQFANDEALARLEK